MVTNSCRSAAPPKSGELAFCFRVIAKKGFPSKVVRIRTLILECWQDINTRTTVIGLSCDPEIDLNSSPVLNHLFP
jgi:hypothetical protein